MPDDNKTLSIAVLSGKGGVGKSNLTLNLAFALNNQGARVLLMDCDFGLANLDVLLGITPNAHVQFLLDSNQSPEELVVQLADGLDLLPANSGILDTVEPMSRLPGMLAEKLSDFASGYDYVLMDIGAGIDQTNLLFGAMAMMRIIIITPEPTSLTDSYALIKVMSKRHEIKDHFVVVNHVASAKEEETAYKRLASATEHFLGITPANLGGIHTDKNLPEAVRMQKPLIRAFPESRATLDIVELAEKISRLRTRMLPAIAKYTPLRRVRESEQDS